ncbi:MAG: class I SAM-dependent methyltransferase [Legionellaceae bacterium]|nr:class I SAM-dependent methyltransferase [Legionellaceae bacterium]
MESTSSFFPKKINKILKVFGLQRLPSPPVQPFAPPKIPFAKRNTWKKRVAELEAKMNAHEQTFTHLIRYVMKTHWRTIDLIEQMSGSHTPSACPLCAHQSDQETFKEIESTCIFHGGRLLRHVCPNCDVIFGAQKMLGLDDEQLDMEYRNIYRIYSESDPSASVIKTFHLLSPKKEGVYLDFGCGGHWSDAIQQLRQEGWNIYGFEPSATHSSAYVFSTWEEIEAMRFDGILSHNVLEHLLDPIDINKRLSRLLLPQGKLVHATPCFEYLYEYTRYHVFFFVGRSAEILAQRSEMQIIHWIREGEYIACVMQKDA